MRYQGQLKRDVGLFSWISVTWHMGAVSGAAQGLLNVGIFMARGEEYTAQSARYRWKIGWIMLNILLVGVLQLDLFIVLFHSL